MTPHTLVSTPAKAQRTMTKTRQPGGWGEGGGVSNSRAQPLASILSAGGSRGEGTVC